MSISLEVDSFDVDIDLTATEDPFLINDSAPAADEPQSESESSFLDIDDEDIDNTESNDYQVNEELEYVSGYTISVIPELYYEILSL